MSRETVTMWSIVDACTKGKIREVTGEVYAGSGGMRYFREGYGYHMSVGRDVFATEAEAEEAARAKVAKRIKSLEKTLAKMRKNPFALPTSEEAGA